MYERNHIYWLGDQGAAFTLRAAWFRAAPSCNVPLILHTPSTDSHLPQPPCCASCCLQVKSQLGFTPGLSCSSLVRSPTQGPRRQLPSSCSLVRQAGLLSRNVSRWIAEATKSCVCVSLDAAPLLLHANE